MADMPTTEIPHIFNRLYFNNMPTNVISGYLLLLFVCRGAIGEIGEPGPEGEPGDVNLPLRFGDPGPEGEPGFQGTSPCKVHTCHAKCMPGAYLYRF